MISYKEYIQKLNNTIGESFFEEGVEVRTYNHYKGSELVEVEYVVVDPLTQVEITLESATCIDDARLFIRTNYLNK